MKNLNNDELMDYVDGTLDAARMAAVEAHLKSHAEDAQLAADMKAALGVLKEWDEAEPVRVADDFWPKLRDKLPERPRRSWLRGTLAQLSGTLRPTPSRLGWGAAFAALFIALGSFWFAPQKATHQVMADKLTPEEKTFIRQSLDRHGAYDSSQPLGASLPLAGGDERSAEHGDNEDDDGEDYTP